MDSHNKMFIKAKENIGKRFLEFINANPDKPWDWRWISKNPNLTMETINANPDKPWDWQWISINQNLTMEFITANSDKPWDWGRMGISSNKFTYEYNIELLNLYLKKHKESMKKVFEEFEEVLLNPDNMEMAKKLGVYSGLSSEW